MAHEEDKDSQEPQPQEDVNRETGHSAQPSTEANSESPTSIAPSVEEASFPRTPSASPLVLGNDLLSSLPSTSRPKSPNDNLGRESDTMFSGDLDVQTTSNTDDWQEEPPALNRISSEMINNDLPPATNNTTSVSNVLPDILGENSFSSVKADLLAKMKKIDGLILNAQQIQTKYQGVDSDSLRSIEDMLHKLYHQKVELQNELALLLTVNDKIAGPLDQAASGRQSSAEAPTSRPQAPLPVKTAPVATATSSPAVADGSSQQMNLAKSIKDLTNNLREITKQKVDLEKMVQVLHVRKSQAQSKEEAEHFGILIHRHEVQVKELDRTVNDAGETLVSMKQIQARMGGDVEDEDEVKPDPSLIALRSRLKQMRTRLDDITQDEQPQSSGSILHESTIVPQSLYDNQRGFRMLAGRHDQENVEQYQPQTQQKLPHQQQHPQSQRGFRLQTADLMFPAEGPAQSRDLNNTGKGQTDNRDVNERHYNRFVIDNIHSGNAGQHPPMMDDQRPYSYVPLNDEPSSDSEVEHAAEMKLQQLQAMYNTTPKKNLNSRSWKNAAGSSRTYEDGSVGGQNELMPEMLNSLQTMISEQQKMLNYCAGFVSKQQNTQSPTPDGGTSSMQRQDRDRIPFINNTLREMPQYFYNMPPPSGRHRSKPRRDNTGYVAAGGLLNNQRNDARMSSVSPNIGDFARSSDYCDNREAGRHQNRSTVSRADQAAPIRELMETILHQYEHDLGSLHYMLDCLSAVRTKQGRASVAAQLGMAVAVECARDEKQHSRSVLPPPAAFDRDSQTLLTAGRSCSAVLSDRPSGFQVLPPRQRPAEEYRRRAHPTTSVLGRAAPDLVGSGGTRLAETGRNSYPSGYDDRKMAQGDAYGMSTVSRFRQGSNNGSLIDYVQQRVQQIRSEDGLSLPQSANSYPFATNSMTQSDEMINNAIRMGLPRNNGLQGGANSYLASNNGVLTSDDYCDPQSGASGASADYDLVRDFGQNM